MGNHAKLLFLVLALAGCASRPASKTAAQGSAAVSRSPAAGKCSVGPVKDTCSYWYTAGDHHAEPKLKTYNIDDPGCSVSCSGADEDAICLPASCAAGRRSSECSCDKVEGACFAKGTRIDTPSGPVAIDRLRVGDEVYSYDFGKKRRHVSRVVETHARTAQETLEFSLGSGIRLVTTAEHPFYAPQKGLWLRADTFRAGDPLLLSSGDAMSLSVLTEIKYTQAAADVFNITVEPHHNYFAEGVLVHNKPGL